MKVSSGLVRGKFLYNFDTSVINIFIQYWCSNFWIIFFNMAKTLVRLLYNLTQTPWTFWASSKSYLSYFQQQSARYSCYFCCGFMLKFCIFLKYSACSSLKSLLIYNLSTDSTNCTYSDGWFVYVLVILSWF